MTVQNQNVKNVYRGNGSAIVFPFTFAINKEHPEYIHVYITNDGDKAVETNDFTCDMEAKTITYPKTTSSAAKLSSTQRLTIYRLLPYTQELNLVNQGPFFAEDVETELDDLEMQIQQQKEESGRSLQVGLEVEDFDTTIPIEAGKTFRVKDDGTGFELTEDPAVAHAAAVAAQEAAERAQGLAEDAQRKAEDAQEDSEAAKDEAEAIASQIDIMARALVYDSVAAMKADTTLADDQTAFTNGYYAINDGGAAVYTIRAKTAGDVEDGRYVIFMDNGNVAELINIENYIPAGYTRTTYSKTGVGTSIIYYAIIPKDYKPELTLANNTLNTVENTAKNAYENKSSLTVNAGIFSVDTNVPIGIIIKDGQVLRNNDVTPEHGGRSADVATLYMLADGTLNSIVSVNTPTEDITALNPVWAVQGWYPIIENGENVSTRHSDDDYQPLTCIGQDYDGNYFVMVVEGRSPVSAGMSLPDVYDFVKNKLGLNLRFLYNLDGGGSSSFVYHGIRQNALTQHEDRPVANFITFRREAIRSDDTFQNMYSLEKDKIRIGEDIPLGNSIIGKEINQISLFQQNASGRQGFNFYKVDKSVSPYKYTRYCQLGFDSENSYIYIDALVGSTFIEVFRFDPTNCIILGEKSYRLATKPEPLNINWNSKITVSDSNCCRIGEFVCLHAALTVNEEIGTYQGVVSGLPYMHANYISVPLLNVATGAVYRLSGHYNNATIGTVLSSGSRAIPAGTYIIDTNYPRYNH